MTRYARTRPQVKGGSAGQRSATTTIKVTDLADDVHAWSGIFLADGRVVSLAWLRGYPGATCSAGGRRD